MQHTEGTCKGSFFCVIYSQKRGDHESDKGRYHPKYFRRFLLILIIKK